jgi:hypothetical protein
LPKQVFATATIRTRKQADGTTRYTAIVRIRRGGVILHRESRTFAHRAAAITWAKHREVALEDPSVLVPVKQDATTVAELIRWYIETFQTISKWQRSKQAHLEFLERSALGKLDVYDLTAAILIDHVPSAGHGRYRSARSASTSGGYPPRHRCRSLPAASKSP